MISRSHTTQSFETTGASADTIDVKISHRIIQLFSEGLYSSPNKAVEELVSNSFDANARNVHVILSPDLRDEEATIAVIDDGEGMDVAGLKQHWIIGRSTRRKGTGPLGRKPIGKFGIGKLATYVLASKLTHICKSNRRFYAATMDYSPLDYKGRADTAGAEGGVFDEQSISIPLRELTSEEAIEVLRPWVSGKTDGYKQLQLFGENAKETWTVAILSDLKSMGRKIQRGRLRWILRTAMPLRDDFKLYLDGHQIQPSKIELPLIEKWIIGKDIKQLADPCPKGLELTEDTQLPEDSLQRYGLSHDVLGRVTGYVELFEDELSGGKSEVVGRSNGFFVYVRGRMINTEDPGFGIERNLLRHGTFSRFRMVVHIDSLDEALRSSRESLQQGQLYTLAKNFLHAAFNLARNRLVEHERQRSPLALISARISSVPGSLTRRPLLGLARLVVENKANPFYSRYAKIPAAGEQEEFLQSLQERFESPEGLLQSMELADLDSKDGIAVYEINSGKLLINSSHPFVAAFQELFEGRNTGQPLEMIAMAEVLMEAHLYEMSLDESKIREILFRRDELLRQFVRSSARRTAGMIALALMEARDDHRMLEEELRAAIEAIGFANVRRIGGKNKPDGTAEAQLAATENGRVQRYRLGLEAKSGQIVSAHRLNVSGIARHMEDYECDHHIVIGNGFATSSGEDTASVREITSHEENTGRTITLMEVDDLARLVRLVPAKRIGLDRLRDLFRSCRTPEESRSWVDTVSAENTDNWPYREILDTVWHLANESPDEAVEYSAVTTELRHREPPIRILKRDLIECCKAMQVMARGVIFARENSVEVNRRPDLILDDIRAAIGEYPEAERRTIKI